MQYSTLSPWFQAAKSNDIEYIKQNSAQASTSIAYNNKYEGMTALQIAAYFDSSDVV